MSRGKKGKIEHECRIWTNDHGSICLHLFLKNQYV